MKTPFCKYIYNFFKKLGNGDEHKSAKLFLEMVFTFFPFFVRQTVPYLAWNWIVWSRGRLNAKNSQTRTSSEIWSEFTNLIWWHWAEFWLTHTDDSSDDAGYRSRSLCRSLQHLYIGQNHKMYLHYKYNEIKTIFNNVN